MLTLPPHPTAYYVKTGALLLTVVGAAVSGAVRYRHLPPNLRYLAWLTWFELPLEILAVWLGIFKRNNLFIMPFYTVGELGLLALVYSHTLPSAAFKRVVTWLVAGFATYTLADNLLAPDLTWFKPGQQVIQSLLILGMVEQYFQRLLKELWVPHLERVPMFWVSVGLAFYFLGYLQIALFSNYMLQHYSMEFNRTIWTIEHYLALLLHSCFGAAILLAPQHQSTGQQTIAEQEAYRLPGIPAYKKKL
ncbi:hypothetical protein GKZ68_10940 [Hymenobacter sp. BRD128]|uniref:hypothetical protein n=1 Tax=Hymenobacter sp. BRD128 TaxID=2675878 RepID=UPI001564523C|nr:hypothetical protein [Hymenobacter sp. BRD128]QKG57099.1 hypothetical protein GKZ68_10940 [Hymenobacter sp. BRD128]